MRIGIVDLDTSHPGNWVPIIRQLGHEVVGVYDGGTVHEAGYADGFAEKHGIARVYDSPEKMAGEVDLAVIHTVDWDKHIERARPFVEAGTAVLIDKPLAGCTADLRQLLEWERGGARISGGSSLAVCAEVTDWKRRLAADDDELLTVFAGCAVDEFNYGIHAYSMLLGMMGPGIESARSLGSYVQHQVELVWWDGRRGIVNVGGTAGYLPFYATAVTQTKVEYIQVNNGHLYRSLLEASLPYLAGEAEPFLPLASLVEAELAAIAARASMRAGGRLIRLDDAEALAHGSYDGGEFAGLYRRKVKGI